MDEPNKDPEIAGILPKELDPRDFYLVSNPLEKPIVRTWTFWLLSPEHLRQFMEFRQTEQYKGRSNIEINARKKLPLQHKLQQWIDINQIGTPHFLSHNADPLGATHYYFELLPGDNILTANQVVYFRKLERQSIPQNPILGRENPPQQEGFLVIKELDIEDAMSRAEVLAKARMTTEQKTLFDAQIRLKEQEAENVELLDKVNSLEKAVAELQALSSINDPLEKDKQKNKPK